MNFRNVVATCSLMALAFMALAPFGLCAKGRLFDESLLRKAVRIIDKNYWKRPVDDRTIVKGAVQGILDELNSIEAAEKAREGKIPVGEVRTFNALLDRSHYKLLRQELAGGFSGIGSQIELDAETGLVRLSNVLPGSPSKKAGLRNGDLIVAIDGKSVKGKKLDEVISLLRGRTGSRVDLRVQRKGDLLPVFSFARGPVSIPSVYGAVLEDGYAYLRISSFNRRTAAAVRRELRKYSRAGCKGLVLDLRSNPGGKLEASVEVCDAFLDKGAPVVGTQKEGRGEKLIRASKPALWKGSVLCLIDEKTASGAEIVAGALREHGALLLGRRSFGKDSVQTVYELPDGFALKLSTTMLRLRGLRGGCRLLPDVQLPSPGADSKKHGLPLFLDLEKVRADSWVQAALSILEFS